MNAAAVLVSFVRLTSGVNDGMNSAISLLNLKLAFGRKAGASAWSFAKPDELLRLDDVSESDTSLSESADPACVSSSSLSLCASLSSKTRPGRGAHAQAP